MARNNWRVRTTVQVDGRDFILRRFNDLQLGLVINRHRAQMYGPTDYQAKADLVAVSIEDGDRLPWELDFLE